MNKELEQKLFAKYPKIFRDADKSPQESCMAFGLEVGDGWYSLIDVLCEALTYTFTSSIAISEEDGKRLNVKPHSDKDGKPFYYFSVKSPQVVADQVKEKFGTLRFYYHLVYDDDNISLIETGKYPELDKLNKRYADYLDGVVHFAETASARTCSVRGTEGEMHVRGGWLKVISPEVAKQNTHDGYKLFNNEN